MKKLMILLVTVFTFFSCSIPKDEDLSGVNIRLTNVSQYDFKNITVNTSTGVRTFEDINAGQSTNYQVFELAYRYAFVELEIDGQTFTIQPTDYVGETPLENRLYTYQIDASDSQNRFGRLSLILVLD